MLLDESGVPTEWLTLLDHLRSSRQRLDTLERVVIGGSAPPRALLETLQKEHGVGVIHTWGMTELCPLGTIALVPPELGSEPFERTLEFRLKQGRPAFGIELRVTDDEGRDLPHDGKTYGHLKVRGLWVTAGYYRAEGPTAVDSDGWFDTGDVATIDARGFLQITDRAKDVIRSGGEWISSIEIENQAMGHPGVVEAAVIGLPHPVLDERPLLVCVKRRDTFVSREDPPDPPAQRLRVQRRLCASALGKSAEFRLI